MCRNKSEKGDGEIQKFQKSCFAILSDSFPRHENEKNSLPSPAFNSFCNLFFSYSLLPIDVSMWAFLNIYIYTYINTYFNFYKIYEFYHLILKNMYHFKIKMRILKSRNNE